MRRIGRRACDQGSWAGPATLNGRWRSATGKATVGLSSHLPCYRLNAYKTEMSRAPHVCSYSEEYGFRLHFTNKPKRCKWAILGDESIKVSSEIAAVCVIWKSYQVNSGQYDHERRCSVTFSSHTTHYTLIAIFRTPPGGEVLTITT